MQKTNADTKYTFQSSFAVTSSKSFHDLQPCGAWFEYQAKCGKNGAKLPTRKYENIANKYKHLIYNNIILGDPEITANLYCNFAYLYWEGCVICSIYLR